MALFVPLDASYDQDPKILDLDDERAELLFVRSLAYSKRHVLDGLIHRRALAGIAPCSADVAPTDLAAELVRVGLWTVTDKGWRITAWLKRNPASEDILTPTKGLELAHQRHHVKKGVVNEACPLCVPNVQVTTHDACVDAVRDASDAMPEPEPVPEPEPSSTSLRTTPVADAPDPSHDVEQAAAPDEQQIRKTAALVGRTIAAAQVGLGNPSAYAAGVTRQILDTTGDGIDRERITRMLGSGETPEGIASGWATDPFGLPAAPEPVLVGPDTAGFYAEREARRQAQMAEQVPVDTVDGLAGLRAAREALRKPVAS